MKRLLPVLSIAVVCIVAVAACVPYGSTVVSKTSFVDHSSAVASTVLYSPTDDADFQVSIYADFPTSASNVGAQISPYITWTDSHGSESSQGVTCSAGGGSSAHFLNNGTGAGCEHHIHALASTNISLVVPYDPSSDSAHYDLYVTVTKE